MTEALVGTSGWQYRHWRGSFYPAGMPTGRWLEHYAQSFGTVEVNATFYRLPEATVFDDWRARVPPDFRFAVKMSRYATHIRRLSDPAEPVDRFLSRARHLRELLGPVLVQLPPTMPVACDRLDATLALLAGRVRVAVELRHASWFVPAVEAILREHGAALALTDRGGRPEGPLWRTADWAYLRFHGGRARGGGYGERSLAGWARRVRELGVGDVYAYFNNDTGGHAPRDAVAFRGMLRG